MPEPKTRFTSKELMRNFGPLSDTALREPVVITKNGRDRLVLLSMESFKSLEGANGGTQERTSRRGNESTG